MIVKCNKIIDDCSGKDLSDNSSWLTVGKQYVVLAMSLNTKYGMYIYLKTDHYHEPAFVSLSGFEVVSQSLPSSWVTVVDELNNIKNVTSLPSKWDYESFFDDVEDSEPKAIELYNSEVEKMFKEEGWDISDIRYE